MRGGEEDVSRAETAHAGADGGVGVRFEHLGGFQRVGVVVDAAGPVGVLGSVAGGAVGDPGYATVGGDEVEAIAADFVGGGEGAELRFHTHCEELRDQAFDLQADVGGGEFAEGVVFTAPVGVAARSHGVDCIAGRVGGAP